MANPTSVISWDVFVGADSYDISVKNNGGSVVGQVLGHTSTSIDLLSVIDAATPAGSNFKAEVRAVVNGFKTLWYASPLFVWDPSYPGTVVNITVV